MQKQGYLDNPTVNGDNDDNDSDFSLERDRKSPRKRQRTNSIKSDKQKHNDGKITALELEVVKYLTSAPNRGGNPSSISPLPPKNTTITNVPLGSPVKNGTQAINPKLNGLSSLAGGDKNTKQEIH